MVIFNSLVRKRRRIKNKTTLDKYYLRNRIWGPKTLRESRRVGTNLRGLGKKVGRKCGIVPSAPAKASWWSYSKIKTLRATRGEARGEEGVKKVFAPPSHTSAIPVGPSQVDQLLGELDPLFGLVPELEDVARHDGVLVDHLELSRQRRGALARDAVQNLRYEGNTGRGKVEDSGHGAWPRDGRDHELGQVLKKHVGQELPAQANGLQAVKRAPFAHVLQAAQERELGRRQGPHHGARDREAKRQLAVHQPLPDEAVAKEVPVSHQVEVRDEGGQQQQRGDAVHDRPALKDLPVLHGQKPVVFLPDEPRFPAGSIPGKGGQVAQPDRRPHPAAEVAGREGQGPPVVVSEFVGVALLLLIVVPLRLQPAVLPRERPAAAPTLTDVEIISRHKGQVLSLFPSPSGGAGGIIGRGGWGSFRRLIVLNVGAERAADEADELATLKLIQGAEVQEVHHGFCSTRAGILRGVVVLGA